ncbi:hypothetical protein [Beggiatoa leptomitoformis]|uniref:DUF3311 domain-containing protein n=1 Tax=Beggiatoa leptomitoformis TaxID=288004 RepID=A0A2N9YFP9_9GAMM|nr:hypothetical protein [Beggiatoa leptomitoformis]ALG68463.1 hypothetical protein AL038_13090 [Beggiatoa leptomitoformis]AUI69205.1 hypothetical protein BLE401_11180 [Beggiatoa leptomitoformis]
MHTTASYLLSLLLFGTLLFIYPLLSLFSQAILIFGIPLLYIYLFIVWLIFIGFTALILHKTDSTPKGEE